jgi:hypothetical protein
LLFRGQLGIEASTSINSDKLMAADSSKPDGAIAPAAIHGSLIAGVGRAHGADGARLNALPEVQAVLAKIAFPRINAVLVEFATGERNIGRADDIEFQ